MAMINLDVSRLDIGSRPEEVVPRLNFLRDTARHNDVIICQTLLESTKRDLAQSFVFR